MKKFKVLIGVMFISFNGSFSYNASLCKTEMDVDFQELDITSAHPKVGYDQYLKIIQDSLIYPLEAKDAGLEGIVSVNLYIQKDGSPTIYHVFDFGFGSKKEAIRLISLGGEWVPAINNETGDSLGQFVLIPIVFEL